jgi:transposase
MRKRKVVFNRYGRNQPMLLPASYEDLGPRNHHVSVVNEIIERIDIGALEAFYKCTSTQPSEV